MTQQIVPKIWCDGNAEEMASFYENAFRGSGREIHIEVDGRYPETGLADFQQALAGKALSVTMTIEGYRIGLINGGPEYAPNASVSFALNFDAAILSGGAACARETLDLLWDALLVGGAEVIPLGESPLSDKYGWVRDRFGVHWQLVLASPNRSPRPFVLPAMTFACAAQNRATEALALYTSVFEKLPGGAGVTNTQSYGAQVGKASAEALVFGEFHLGDDWFIAIDNPLEEEHCFTCGVSLEVQCDDQAQIDVVWDALSASPEAEQCGWLVDEFGVSWQVVPKNMGELMARPNAFEHMMGMKKLVINDF
ncbi:VOC family protein [Leucobacter sp. cx-328]|uniref:VOC family protein n=1 Tax=unclassified Leucobacter TaxID=2621730 RepID=UPI00165DD50D|nr:MULTISPECIES: VOC family protein [unclassified Leucobacter]MBC9944514.1 VOC family protein [Leucobacter sp. cx-328]